ncbi:unnamed protein product [Strongylus vulgaris]|uniref:Peptidase C1A papain C-terminal domain-containing protein n=1 Tax=Strongylus vulgaris TaxID=40348 RepID=A0A3P7ISB5_STRVU|nr:unnamed protein product [Strongylus vulgaris]
MDILDIYTYIYPYFGLIIFNQGKSSYSIPANVASIQREIMKNGPVITVFRVYTDFMYYKTGVYTQNIETLQYTWGYLHGAHTAKIIGWGVDGVDYWLAANSYNTDWGEKGFFRIRRGINECGFEERIYAGDVMLENV